MKILTPLEIQPLLNQGALLIDIRDTDAWQLEHIQGALSLPFPCSESGVLSHLPLMGKQVVFYCQTGQRTAALAARLKVMAHGAEVCMLKNGLNGWKKAQFITVFNPSLPLPLSRQVQMLAGFMIMAGVLLGSAFSYYFYFLPSLIGAGQIFAGVTGWCGMARLLGRLPWNRQG